MVKFVRDMVHGFQERPHYEPRELDMLFEKIVVDFLRKKSSEVKFPIDTEDLKTLIERDVTDLDQYADLTAFGHGVEGLTEFPRKGRPKVFISADVHKNENRLRTTLTHEYGHVHLHAYLFGTGQRSLGLGPNQKPNAVYCKRDTMMPVGKTDWMEWQAGYACGAILMPRNFVTRAIAPIKEACGIYGPVSVASPNGQALIDAVVDGFSVSRDAARVRLSVLGHLGQETATRSLFS